MIFFTIISLKLPEFDKIYYSDFTKTVFIAFMLMMHILLLNMLIAMMGNTYHQITKKSEKEWKKQVKLFGNFIFCKNYIISLIKKISGPE